jgi:hypothetical protein
VEPTVQTDRTVPNNKPDSIMSDNKQETYTIIEVTITGDRNVIKRETEKILKHNDLTIEIEVMWNVKVKVIPVIIGATGIISKSLKQYLSNIPGKQKIKKQQKLAIFGAAHKLWQVLM